MITRRLLTVLTLLFSVSTISYSQTWTQVWADEFNTIGPDWVFEIGTGSGGWGNNELQYYRRENAAIVNGQLEITARREAFGGMNYTSARMKTQGRKSWKYGKMEARISMPSFQGVWPAFWMLGDNITSVGWPAGGEIDIMEHVNTGGQVFGTIHWSDQNNNYAQYSGNTSTSITAMHTYAVEWNASSIKWFVDGVQFHIVDIANGINGTAEFHNNFFILLNMAIGGNWPGFTVDNNSFPAKMIVDYVRVFQAGTTPPTDGVATVYKDCNFAGTAVGLPVGDYTLSQLNGRGILNDDISSLRVNSGYEIVVYQNDNFTGSASTFSAEDACLVDNGINDYVTSLRVRARTNSFSQTIQSESYSSMANVQKETTSDAGGGENVGWIETGDWMAYNGINIPTTGNYLVEYRVASPTGGNISLDINGGATVLGSVAVPATGGWQSWRTISHTVNIPAGTHNFGTFAVTGGFNINWFRISSAAARRSSAPESKVTQVNVFPSTVVSELNVETPEELSGASVKIANAQGVVKYSGILTGAKINVANLNQGLYTITISKNGNKVTKKFIKE